MIVPDPFPRGNPRSPHTRAELVVRELQESLGCLPQGVLLHQWPGPTTSPSGLNSDR